MPKASTSTKPPSSPLDAALAGVPAPFRPRLLEQYLAIRAAYASGDYDAVGLRTGALAETVLRLLQQLLTGTHVAFGTPLPPFEDECTKLQRLPRTAGHESLRIVLPRALSFLYTVRNKRGIGHVGGDVEANAVDAATCSRLADWVICELLRLYHGLSLEEAQTLVDNLASRELPTVWAVAGRKRVLDTSLDYRAQTLVLLYSDASTAVLVEDLQAWVEYPESSKFRTRVLTPLHRERLIEWDEDDGAVLLSPKGAQYVEKRILRK